MSSNRLFYDKCAYDTDVQQSMNVSKYVLGEPVISCKPCYPESPNVRLQSQGDSIYRNTLLVDIDSELMNLNRKLARDPCNHYSPDQRPSDKNLFHFSDCNFISMINCRMDNPPCNLRGTGINRFEWLCKDPQQLPHSLLMPFDFNVSNRLLVKDNHRPCIPTPLDMTSALPKGGELPQQEPVKGLPHISSNPVDPPSVGWQRSHNIRNY